jgi:hypothetical protein
MFVKARVLVLSILGLFCMALTGCGTSLSQIVGSTSSTAPKAIGGQGAPTTTLPSATGLAFPVVACTSISGGSLGTQGWRPTYLMAPIPTALVGKVEFYSDGVHTVLAPIGWTCAQSVTTSTGRGLAVFPPGVSSPPVFGPPAPGTEGVFANFDATRNPSGLAMVCPFFTVSASQRRQATCSTARPPTEQVTMPTPEVATVTDPTGVAGSLGASGGSHPVEGVVIFPQIIPAVTNGSSINVAEESCSLSETSLCPTILSDFEVREFPVSSVSTAPIATVTPPTTRPTAPTTTAPNPAPTTTSPPAPTPTTAPVTTIPSTPAPPTPAPTPAT